MTKHTQARSRPQRMLLDPTDAVSTRAAAPASADNWTAVNKGRGMYTWTWTGGPQGAVTTDNVTGKTTGGASNYGITYNGGFNRAESTRPQGTPEELGLQPGTAFYTQVQYKPRGARTTPAPKAPPPSKRGLEDGSQKVGPAAIQRARRKPAVNRAPLLSAALNPEDEKRKGLLV